MGACCSSQTAAQVAEPSKPIAAQKSETDFRNTRSVSKIRESVEEKLDDARYEDVDVLITIPFFDDLDKKHLKDLRQLFSREKYEKDQVICEEGKNHNMFYVIVNGSARLTTRTADGEFELAVLGKGNWFGEIALMDDSLQAVTARAMEKTTILSMTMQQYQDAVKRHPDLSVSISTFGNIPPLKVQLKTIPFFATVPDRKLQLLAALVEIRKCQPAEVLCRQGEDADGFYYIIEGRANVSASGHDGQQVHLDSLGPGMWFGEIALMENTQRTATVTSQQACSLLYLSRERFNRFLKLAPEIIETGVLQRLITKRTANSLKAIPLFQEFRTKELGPLEKFDENKLHLLGELFKFVQFQAGQKIFSEGDVADAFYIIVSGTLDVMASDPSGKVLKLAELNQSDWFGELALVQEGGKRNSTVVAVVPTLLLRLGRENFHKFMQLTPGIESLLRARIDVRTADRLAKIPFFSGIRENRPWSKLDLLGGLFRFEEYPAGHVVFQEGEKGDKFYVIVEGSVSVSVTRPEKGDVVIDKLKKDMWFGEIALLQRTPRTASITCDEQCVFITLAADQFQLFLCVAPELSEPFSALVSHRTANVLRTLDLFRNVRENKPWSKLELLGTLFTYEQRPAGETVIKFGEPATTFFLIIRGKVNISGRTDDGKDEDLGFASAQQHFGEVALLRNRPHNTTVVTVEPCMFLCLTKRAFQQFMKVAPELKPYFQEIVHNRRQSVSTSFLVESDSIELDFPREDSSGTISRSDSLDQKIAVLEARAARSAAQEQRAHDALVDSVPEDPEEKEEPGAKEETPAKEADAAKPDGSDEKTSDQI